MNIPKSMGIQALLIALISATSVASPYDGLANYRYNPHVRAFLDVISYAEGTNHAQGYRMQYPGVMFADFDDHPRTINCALFKGKLLCATAAGRYMFLRRTWDRLAPKIKAYDFSPLNQDRAAIALICENKAIDDIMAGKFEVAVKKLNKVWATLPGAPYGQATKTMPELKAIFRQRLMYYK